MSGKQQGLVFLNPFKLFTEFAGT